MLPAASPSSALRPDAVAFTPGATAFPGAQAPAPQQPGGPAFNRASFAAHDAGSDSANLPSSGKQILNPDAPPFIPGEAARAPAYLGPIACPPIMMPVPSHHVVFPQPVAVIPTFTNQYDRPDWRRPSDFEYRRVAAEMPAAPQPPTEELQVEPQQQQPPPSQPIKKSWSAVAAAPPPPEAPRRPQPRQNDRRSNAAAIASRQPTPTVPQPQQRRSSLKKVSAAPPAATPAPPADSEWTLVGGDARPPRAQRPRTQQQPKAPPSLRFGSAAATSNRGRGDVTLPAREAERLESGPATPTTVAGAPTAPAAVSGAPATATVPAAASGAPATATVPAAVSGTPATSTAAVVAPAASAAPAVVSGAPAATTEPAGAAVSSAAPAVADISESPAAPPAVSPAVECPVPVPVATAAAPSAAAAVPTTSNKASRKIKNAALKAPVTGKPTFASVLTSCVPRPQIKVDAEKKAEPVTAAAPVAAKVAAMATATATAVAATVAALSTTAATVAETDEKVGKQVEPEEAPVEQETGGKTDVDKEAIAAEEEEPKLSLSESSSSMGSVSCQLTSRSYTLHQLLAFRRGMQDLLNEATRRNNVLKVNPYGSGTRWTFQEAALYIPPEIRRSPAAAAPAAALEKEEEWRRVGSRGGSSGRAAGRPRGGSGGFGSRDDESGWRPASASSPAASRARDLSPHTRVLRTLRSLLNKLTYEKFDDLFQQILDSGMSDLRDIAGLVSLVFTKAKTQHHFIPMYVELCLRLIDSLPDKLFENTPTDQADIPETEEPESNAAKGEDDDERPKDKKKKKDFRRCLVNECQIAFEEMLTPLQVPTDLDEEEAFEWLLLEKKKMKGTVMFVGELHKGKAISAKVVLGVMKHLYTATHEEAIEALCQLLLNVGATMARGKHSVQLGQSMKIVEELSQRPEFSTRIRFLLKDVVEDAARGWPKSSAFGSEGPKTLKEIHATVKRPQPTARPSSSAAPYGRSSTTREQIDDGFKTARSSKGRQPSIHRFFPSGAAPLPRALTTRGEIDRSTNKQRQSQQQQTMPTLAESSVVPTATAGGSTTAVAAANTGTGAGNDAAQENTLPESCADVAKKAAIPIRNGNFADAKEKMSSISGEDALASFVSAILEEMSSWRVAEQSQLGNFFSYALKENVLESDVMVAGLKQFKDRRLEDLVCDFPRLGEVVKEIVSAISEPLGDKYAAEALKQF